MISRIYTISKREFISYFATPLAPIFMIIFVLMSGFTTFYAGSFFERNQADMQSFFIFHPWLYMFMMPAIAMRLWAEERKTGTIELILTLPVTTTEVVIGKFLAALFFTIITLGLTFPLWITVNLLGDPDNGVIFTSYIASTLMAGAFLAISSCISATTKSQVISFVASMVACSCFMISGLEFFLSFISAVAPELLVKTIASFSFLTHFSTITRGVIDIKSIVFFVSLTSLWLFANTVVVDYKKAS